jgi:hypothetical protein
MAVDMQRRKYIWLAEDYFKVFNWQLPKIQLSMLHQNVLRWYKLDEKVLRYRHLSSRLIVLMSKIRKFGSHEMTTDNVYNLLNVNKLIKTRITNVWSILKYDSPTAKWILVNIYHYYIHIPGIWAIARSDWFPTAFRPSAYILLVEKAGKNMSVHEGFTEVREPKLLVLIQKYKPSPRI